MDVSDARFLQRITEATAERDEAQEEVRLLDDSWRSLIGSAVDLGVPATAVAQAAGISRQRVYQIRRETM